jgi:hypothetical protein
MAYETENPAEETDDSRTISDQASDLSKCDALALRNDLISGIPFQSTEAIDVFFARIDQLSKFVSTVKKLAELGAIQFIKEQCPTGDFIESGIRYYVGKEKTTKCKDVGAFLEKMLVVGDVEAIKSMLASGAWKHGAAEQELHRLNLDDIYREFFETKEVPDLKTGKPKHKLNRLDPKFAKAKVLGDPNALV